MEMTVLPFSQVTAKGCGVVSRNSRYMLKLDGIVMSRKEIASFW